MSIDPGVRKVLEIGASLDELPFEAGSADQARRAYLASVARLQGDRIAIGSLDDLVVPGPHGPIPIRVYRGTQAPQSGAPLLLYCHGGGWVVGNLESHDEICRLIAERAKAVVVCPDYRLAPEFKFPHALDDCVATLEWAYAQRNELGVDPRRIAVGGDSAGGNLAAVLALISATGKGPRLSAQLLIYPNTDARQTAASYGRFGEGFGLTRSTMRWFRDQYVRDEADIADWRVSPLLADDLRGAPPAFVAIAAHDILADEGAAYASRLEKAEVPVLVSRWPNQIHGFASMGRFVADATRVIEHAVDAWRKFAPETPR
jgi:acetyl esterase